VQCWAWGYEKENELACYGQLYSEEGGFEACLRELDQNPTSAGYCGPWEGSAEQWISTCHGLDIVRVTPGCSFQVKLEDGSIHDFNADTHVCKAPGCDSVREIRVFPSDGSTPDSDAECWVGLYADCFSGQEVWLNEGHYGLHDLGIGDSVSSITVQGEGCVAELHPHHTGDGEAWYFSEGDFNCDDFGAHADHDSASEVVIYKAPEGKCSVALYADCFSGHEVVLSEGHYGLHELGIGDSVSSIRVHGTDCVAELHPHNKDDGQPWYFIEGDFDCNAFGKKAEHDSASEVVIYTYKRVQKCTRIPVAQARKLGASQCNSTTSSPSVSLQIR